MMNKPLRRLLAGLTLAAAATTGALTATRTHTAADNTTVQADTAWGAPSPGSTLQTVTDDASSIAATPLDTAWG